MVLSQSVHLAQRAILVRAGRGIRRSVLLACRGVGLRPSGVAVSPEDACHHTEREPRLRGRGASAHFDADLNGFKDFAFGGACGCCLLDVPLHA